jgi:adenosylhomocysteinase
MKDGAIVANSGHFNDEIDIPALEGMSAPPATVRPFVQAYRRKAGGTIFLLAEGRLINLAAAEGHPAAVMDMSFANQALGLEWLLGHAAELTPTVHSIPEDIDREIARIKLGSLGVKIDSLSEAQERYAQGWEAGT